MSLSFDEYQTGIDHTLIYRDKIRGILDGLGVEAQAVEDLLCQAYAGLGLGEAGEIQGKLKKVLRDSGGVITDEVRAKIAGELGDSLWYHAALAKEFGLKLSDVASANLEKLADRKERGTLQGSGDER
jgi:NTP pyrophosphatase (non-canonical NTP hydrolase)